MYRIDNWINEGSGWIVESIDGEYVNISAYSPLVGSTYIELPDELKNSMKGLINIKNSDNRCFLWCNIRHLNLVKTHRERITKNKNKKKKIKELVSKLNYEEINFPVSKKDYCKIEKQNNIYINVFCHDNKLTYPVYLSDQKFESCMDLLLISDECKSHYVYIKNFDRFMFNKIRYKTRKYFCKCCLQCFSSKEILIEHRTDCLVINGKQGVKLKSGTIKFKNYFKQLPVPFMIYADFECIFKKVESDIIGRDLNSSYTRKYQDHIIPCSFAYKIVCIDNKLSKKVALYRGKNAVYKFIKSFLNEYNYCRKLKKKHVSKNLIMSAKEEERVQLSDIC